MNVKRFLSAITERRWGNEMEIPNYDAYTAARKGLGKTVYRAHEDGHNVWELASVKLESMEENAKFTLDVLRYLEEKGGPLHSFPRLPVEMPTKRQVKERCVQCKKNNRHMKCSHGQVRRDIDIPCSPNIWYRRSRDCPDDCEFLKEKCPECDPVFQWIRNVGGWYNDCSSSSNHLHFSPYDFSIYRKLYSLIRSFTPFFCNSPLGGIDGDVTLSSRHISGQWCAKEFIENRDEFDGSHGRFGYALTPNSLGTLEFRFNDLSKNPMQVAMYCYLVSIADHLPLNLLTKYADKINFPEIMSHAKSAKRNAFALARKIGATVGDNITFYNFYNRRYQNFPDLIKNVWNFEQRYFESWDGNNNAMMDAWSEKWFKVLSRSRVPKKLILNDGYNLLFDMDRGLAARIMKENAKLDANVLNKLAKFHNIRR